MGNINNKTRSAIILMIFTLGGKFLGFLRELLIALKFGSGMETDAFFIALTATGILNGFILSAVSTTCIPVMSVVEHREGKQGKVIHTNNMINVMFIVALILSFISIIAAPLIIKVLAQGFEGEQFALTVQLARIGSLMIIFSGVIGVIVGYLQSEDNFISTAIMTIPSNMSYIIYLLLLVPMFGIKGLMIVAVIGSFSQFLVQIPAIFKTNFKYELVFKLKDEYLKKVLFLSLPVLLGIAITDINAIVDKTIASTLAVGSISALNYANKLNQLILGVFITAITTVIFPTLAKEASEENFKGLKKIMNEGLSIIMIIVTPSTAGLIILSKPIIQIAFERGAFDSIATLMTSQALVFYSAGLLFMALRLLLNRVYYSLRDTRTPMINGAISVIVNIIFNLILVRYMGHAGLALGTSIASAVTTILLYRGLIKRLGNLGIQEHVKLFFKLAAVSTIMGVLVYVVYYRLYSILGESDLYNFISLFSAVSVGVVVYIILCYIARIEEIRIVINTLLKKARHILKNINKNN